MTRMRHLTRTHVGVYCESRMEPGKPSAIRTAHTRNTLTYQTAFTGSVDIRAFHDFLCLS